MGAMQTEKRSFIRCDEDLGEGLPFKVSFMLWRVWFGRIPIGEVLIKRRIVESCESCCCVANVARNICSSVH